MKKFVRFLLLLIPLLLASTAFARSGEHPSPETAPEADGISAARSQYTQISHNSPDASDGKALAQFSRRRPGFPSQHGYPRRSYSELRMDYGDGRHAAIGAAIGFGLGALASIKANTDQHANARVGAVFIFGGFGALFGAVIGGTGPFLHARRVYRPSWPGDDEDGDRRSGDKDVPPRESIPTMSVLRQQVGAKAQPAPSSETLAAP